MATVASSYLDQKTNVESNNLKQKLKNQLYKDIFKLYSESIFADVYINVENNVIKSHRCILQTRVPTFYNTYCNHPDLLNYLPISKLSIFIREVYNEGEICKQEEEILRCIDSFFIDKKSSVGNSILANETINSKQRLLQDLSKVNALNNSHVNRLYYRSYSDTSVYYSLVDKSLLLSDYSDVNEEAPDMNGSEEFIGTLTPIDNKTSEKCNEEVVLKQEDTINYFAEGKHSDDSNFHSEFTNSITNTSQKPSKVFKCFIDASDLIDASVVEACEVSLKSASKANSSSAQIILEQTSDSLDGSSNSKSKMEISDNTTDQNQCIDKSIKAKRSLENLDQIHEKDDITVDLGSRNKIDKGSEKYSSDIPSSARSELEMHHTFKNEKEPEFCITNSTDVLPTKKCDIKSKSMSNSALDDMPVAPDTINIVKCPAKLVKSFSSEITSSIDTDLPDIFIRFKSYLLMKYECAKTNHTYSDFELENLKTFDELLSNDIQCQFLKCNLEEIISKTASKTDVALHKFLIKQYEKKHGVEKTSSFMRSLMWDKLKERSYITNVSKEAHNDVLFKTLISSKTSKSELVNTEFEPVKEPVATSKSYGFFIDLKDNSKPTTAPEIKEKVLPAVPPKQLFSMFIDFGNSTDSDSSFEVQNKFERRKKQYMSKIEKSRELSKSSTSKDIVNESKSTIVSSISNQVPRKVEFDANVVRRNKNRVPRSNELRRSWNVDKTNEISQNIVTKHKRSYSVSEQKLDIEIKPFADSSTISNTCNAFLSIGNADSTNELTVNGESEIPNCVPRSEQGAECQLLCSSLADKTWPKSPQNSDNDTGKMKEKTFVKLSDLNKEPKSLTNIEPWPSIRMTKSVTGAESNWLETRLLNGSVNSRSLSRIFPDLGAGSLSKTNSDVDDTTISSISSIQSSSVVSTCESTQELSSLVNKAESHTLGQDLLRMFLDEISTDVMVEVAGRRIKAHKCILTSRCQYFAALLSGGWVESAGNVLSIHGFSYNVVHFALRYIYSGESEIAENINIVELATLADYLCLEGLKEIISSTLKTKYCHFFHKPCNVCSVGVLECLPIAINYGLDDLHRKSLRWISKHYVRLWCTKAFASLPWELIDKCYNQHVVNMTVKNVFETMMNCDKLFSVIPQTRWAEPCFVVTKKLHDFCIKFMANHFVEFLKSDSFTSIASNRTWGIVIMDEKTQVVCSKMRTDHLCQSYAYICEQYKLATTTHENEELIELLSRVKNQIETALVKIALQASQCNAWFQMDLELRSHIQTSAGLTFVPTEAKRKVDALKSKQPVVASSGSRVVDLAQVKSVINRQHRQNNVRTSDTREVRPSGYQRSAIASTRNSFVRQNGVQNKENKVHRIAASNSKSPYRNKYANVKSRYMDRKSEKNDKTASETTPSETSEAEKTSAAKRSSKSLVSSVHLSPAMRQSVRAVSLSKIPVSVRNSSQKRNESDKDTTSGSDNGIINGRRRTGGAEKENSSTRNVTKTMTSSMQSRKATTSRMDQSTVMRDNRSGSSTARNSQEKTSKNMSRSYTKTTQSACAKMRTLANGSRSFTNNENGYDQLANKKRVRNDKLTERRSENNNLQPKCSSDPSSKNNSSSEETMEVSKPNIPFRRDGTFCIDEPLMLRKKTSDHADLV